MPWLMLTTLAYVVLYGLANWWTSRRSDVGLGVFEWERSIPFVGWTIVPYLSICGFFVLSFFVDTEPRALRLHVARLLLVLVVSVACYAAFPLRFTFERPLTDGAIGWMFDALMACDMPYNRAPSLHIGVLSVLWVRFAPHARGWAGLGLRAWFVMIAVSVLTTYQHHVLDVPAGAALGALAIALTAVLAERAAQQRIARRLPTALRGWARIIHGQPPRERRDASAHNMDCIDAAVGTGPWETSRSGSRRRARETAAH